MQVWKTDFWSRSHYSSIPGHSIMEWAGVELVTSRSKVRRPNHYTSKWTILVLLVLTLSTSGYSPYSLDRFCLKWCGLVSHCTTLPVWHYPWTSPVFLRTSQSCRSQSKPSRALQSCILGPPKDWHRRVGRPRQSWLRTVEDDLRPLDFGLATARRNALDRSAWRLLVETATSTWHAPGREISQPTWPTQPAISPGSVKWVVIH